MKYTIKVYQDNVLVCEDTAEKNYRWSVLTKYYHNKVNSFQKKGYRSLIEVTSADGGYTVLFDSKKMKTVVLNYTTVNTTDFKDVRGKEIIVGEYYVGSNGQTYSINRSGWHDGFYLRNYVKEDIFGFPKDLEYVTQADITPLGLKLKKSAKAK